MYRLQRCVIVGMQGLRSLVVAPCAMACLLGVLSPLQASAFATADASLAMFGLNPRP